MIAAFTFMGAWLLGIIAGIFVIPILLDRIRR